MGYRIRQSPTKNPRLPIPQIPNPMVRGDGSKPLICTAQSDCR